MSTPPRFSESPDWDGIARYQAGESDGEETRRISEWLATHPQDAEMLAALDGVLAGQADASAPSSLGEPDVEVALRAVRTRMPDDAATRVLPFPPARSASDARPAFAWVAGGIAAAAAVVGALAVGLGRTHDAGEPGRAVAPGSVITTAIGVRDSVRLPDGTRVVLGPASRLAISPDYGRDGRVVTLAGAAFVVVRHDRAKPFTVHAGPATVRDIGTAFTVRTDDDGGIRGVTVVVTEGEVELDPHYAPASSVTLRAGDRGEVRSDGRVTAARGGGEADLAWMQGRLVYRDTPLERVRTDLRRWYGVDLTMADSSLLERRITATFEGEPVDRVLEVIALALGAQVERRDSVAVLRGSATR